MVDLVLTMGPAAPSSAQFCDLSRARGPWCANVMMDSCELRSARWLKAPVLVCVSACASAPELGRRGRCGIDADLLSCDTKRRESVRLGEITVISDVDCWSATSTMMVVGYTPCQRADKKTVSEGESVCEMIKWGSQRCRSAGPDNQIRTRVAGRGCCAHHASTHHRPPEI